MNTLEYVRIRIDPVSDEDRRLIHQEVAGLVSNLHFASSKRYPALLYYIVEKTLEGHGDELKERILGMEVFHRPADYDTNNDTVVRVAASEVRKRLALTYHETGEDHAIQILLPTGSYVPEFYRHATANTEGGTADGASPAKRQPAKPLGSAHGALLGPSLPWIEAAQPAAASGSARARLRWRSFAAVLAILIAGAASMLLLMRVRANSLETSVDRFWQPVNSSSTPVLLCPGASVPTNADVSGFTEAGKDADYPYISMATAGTLTALVDVFARRHTAYVLEPSSSATLADMRQRPTVLMGAYNNKWTLLMMSQLRYRFTAKPVAEIVDSKDPTHVWKRPDSLPYKDEDDYAIVARFHNRLTDSITFVIAGVGKNGTEAAAQFATSPGYVDLIGRYQHDWAKKNIEVVLKTTAVDGKTSAPSVEAIEVW